MASTATGKRIQYGATTITGQATALLGNKYGDIFNIQQATFLLSSTSIAENSHGQCKVVRQNRVFPNEGYTLETITTFEDGEVLSRRGTSRQVELRWKRREDVGEGVFGEVHREEYCEGEKIRSRAVKVLRRRQLERMRIDYKKELDALIQLSQPEYVHRFVEFYSWYENESNIYLAMEFIPYGDLESCIHVGLKEHDTRQIAYQVLDGIRIMHRLDLIHRDIKPANIFIVQQTPVWWVKIGDFSIGKSTMTKQTSLHTQVGTQGYQAPEVIGLVPTEKSNQYNSKCDIWSFGCLVYEMLTAQLPFPDIGALNRFCNDESPFPAIQIKKAGASRLIAEFAWTMLQTEPESRPTAEEAAFLLAWRCETNSPQDEQHLYFKDCMGRDFRFPWEQCSNWDDMKYMIRLALSYIGHIRHQLLLEDYDLLNAGKEVISGENWVMRVRPGMRLLMRLRPKIVPNNVLQPDTALLTTSDVEKENEYPLLQDSDTKEASELQSHHDCSKAETTSIEVAEIPEACSRASPVGTNPHNKEYIIMPTTDGKLPDDSVSGEGSPAADRSIAEDTSQTPLANASAIPSSESTISDTASARFSTLPNHSLTTGETSRSVSSFEQTERTNGVLNRFFVSSSKCQDEAFKNCEPTETSRISSNEHSEALTNIHRPTSTNMFTDRAVEGDDVTVAEPSQKWEQSIIFIDCFGRSHALKWEACRRWGHMMLNIHSLLIADEDIEPWIRRGHFDLCEADSHRKIRSRHWEASISTDSTIHMTLWHAPPHTAEDSAYRVLWEKAKYKLVDGAFPDPQVGNFPIWADRYVGKPEKDVWASAVLSGSLSSIRRRIRSRTRMRSAPLIFTDCFARRHEIPRSWYRRWKTMKAYIAFVCAPIDDYCHEPHIKLNHFDLYSRELQGTISCDQWRNQSSPGMHIDMLLWPKCERLLRVLSLRNLRTLSILRDDKISQLQMFLPQPVLKQLEQSPASEDEVDGAQDDASVRAVHNAETSTAPLTRKSVADITGWLDRSIDLPADLGLDGFGIHHR